MPYISGKMTWEEAYAESEKRTREEPWTPCEYIEKLFKEQKLGWDVETKKVGEGKKSEDRVYEYSVKPNQYRTKFRCVLVPLLCWRKDCLECPLPEFNLKDIKKVRPDIKWNK